MKTSNVSRYAIHFVIVVFLVISGCDKDDDGPNKTKLLTSGNWKLKAVNGNTSISGTLTVTFGSDKSYREVRINASGVTYTYEGDWQFINNETEIEIEYTDGDEWSFDVEELTSEKLVVEDEGDQYEFKH